MFNGTILGRKSKPEKTERKEARVAYKRSAEDTIVTKTFGFVGGDEKTITYSRRESSTGRTYRDFDGNIVLEVKPKNITYEEPIESTKAAYWRQKHEWVKFDDLEDRLEELRSSDRITDVEVIRTRKKTIRKRHR